MQAKGQQAKACRWSLEAGRGKKKNSFLDPLKKDAVLWHLGFSPVRPVLDSWPSEVQDKKICVFGASLAIQWLGLHQGMGLISDQRTEMLNYTCCSQKKKGAFK